MLANVRAPQGPLHHDPAALRQARQARSLTQVALADAVGVSQGFLSELERGTRGASPELLAKLAAALDCPVEPLERPRPLRCPVCDYRHDPQPNGLVPMHTAESDEWCGGVGRRPKSNRRRRDA